MRFEREQAASGWHAPALSPRLAAAIDAASRANFGEAAAYIGKGCTIPFMGVLGSEFPEARFVITGILGPRSNAHGPNEFLHIPTAKRVTCCVAQIIGDKGRG